MTFPNMTFDDQEVASRTCVGQIVQASDGMASVEKDSATRSEIDQHARSVAGIYGQFPALTAKAASKSYAHFIPEQSENLINCHRLFSVPTPQCRPTGERS